MACRGRRATFARLVASAIVLAVCAFAAAGCGPVGYLQQVHRLATDAVAEAKRAGAEAAAPYEYTSAVAYLAKAREEGDRAEYQSAIEFGRRAEAFAVQASAIARRRQATRRASSAAASGGASGAAEGTPVEETP